MIAAIGTALFFAFTPIFANRAAARLGSLSANFWRLVFAALMLGAWSLAFGEGWGRAGALWFFFGGVAGFGVGGVSMFLSLPRLGSSLSTLIVQTMTAVVAAGVEFAWLGTRVSPLQALAAAATFIGVAIGLLPRSWPRVTPTAFRSGVAWALLSAVGQGMGAVMSRKAFALAAAAHVTTDPGTAAFERVLGGLLIGAMVAGAARVLGRAKAPADHGGWPWVWANALTGPVLGVTCYQWALRSTPAALVQPIVAAAPLLTIPLSRWIERSHPPRPLYYVGAILAVVGATGIVLAR